MTAPTRVLGRSGIAVSAIGLGCWAIGGPFWQDGGWLGYGPVDDDESIRAIRRALDLGVTFFDVADVYGCGHAERVLGRALADRADSRFPENDMRVRFGWNLRDGKQARQLAQLAAISPVLTRDGRSLAQGALGWILARSPRAIPVPGFKTVAQVEENVGALRYAPLDAEALEAIETQRRAFGL
jgi:aryl-alcohol dehydrogenase-like predicted oxidoreductase